MSPQFKKILVGGLIVAVLIGVIFAIRSTKSADGVKPTNPRAEKIKGPLDAPVTILEFSDFQCPSCAYAQSSIKKLMDKFPEVIQLHAYHFPLQMHRYGMDSSLAAECAAEQGKFWSYHDYLFQMQSAWSVDPDARTLFLAYANELGLDRDVFKSCFVNSATQRKVEMDREAGAKLQVSSTPTFFIGEDRLVGAKQLDDQGPELIKKKLESLVQKR